jgi:opacity protein-like surface antigen
MKTFFALAFAILTLPAFAQKTPTAERPDFFAIYPPAPRGTFQPTRPPASTASRDPDLIGPKPFYRSPETWLFGGALDWRYRNGSKDTRGSYIASGRYTLDYIRANPKDGDERGGVRLQLVSESEGARGTALNRVRASEVYAFYRFLLPGVDATVRAGQFVIPFGLAAVYDTPLQPIQPLYEKSLGLRVDTGAMLEGSYGPYRYYVAATTGSGPNRSDFDGNKVVVMRLETTYRTQAETGRLQLGGSLLTGRGPVTSFDTQLPASGTSSARTFVDKTRMAADAIYKLEKLQVRGEFVFGADDQDPVLGYFAEGNLAVSGRITAVGLMRTWKFGDKPQSATALGLGANYQFSKDITVRALYEYERDVPSRAAGGKPTVEQRLTLQTRLNF